MSRRDGWVSRDIASISLFSSRLLQGQPIRRAFRKSLKIIGRRMVSGLHLICGPHGDRSVLSPPGKQCVRQMRAPSTLNGVMNKVND